MAVEYGQVPPANASVAPAPMPVPSPTVVDSPLPSTPIGQPPESTSQTVVPTPGASDQAGQPAPAVELNSAVENLVSTMGVPVEVFEGVTTVDEAYAALQTFIDYNSQTGFTQPAFQEPVQPPQQPTPAPQAEVPAFEFPEGTDPNIVKAFQALQAQNQSIAAESKAVKEALTQWQTQQSQARAMEVFNRANSVIDKLASPKYGVGKNRTFQQRIAYQKLLRDADQLISSYGDKAPGIEAVIHQALWRDGWRPTPAKPNPAPKVDPNNLLRPTVPSGTPRSVSHVPPQQRVANLENNAAFRQGVHEILARPS